MNNSKDYLPAMGFTSLASLYDPLMRLAMREAKFKSRLIQQAILPETGAFLDLGCGTATLTLMIKSARPQAEVAGLDGDPRILAIARRKINKAGVSITLDLAFSYDMPYANDLFDRVLTSLTLHHLNEANLKLTLAEILRVLKPGGELHIADFEGGHGGVAHHLPHPRRRASPAHSSPDGQLLIRMEEAGFADIQFRGDFPTLLGKIGYFSSSKEQGK